LFFFSRRKVGILASLQLDEKEPNPPVGGKAASYLFFLCSSKERTKERAPKNPNNGLCIAQANALQGTKSIISHIFGDCRRTL